MIDIARLRTEFFYEDTLPNELLTVNSNIITKFIVIEGCRNYFDPQSGFHCTKAQKSQQATINLLALVSCGKAIADDLAEICRMLFCEVLKKQNTERNQWRLHFDTIFKKFPDTPLYYIIDKYGLNIQKNETTKFYPKVKKLRDTLIHREINRTFLTTANDFYVSGDFTPTGTKMLGHEYAAEVYKLMQSITVNITQASHS